VTLRPSPRRDRRAPYRFLISGRVLLPSGVTRAQACGSGTVSMRARAGRRTVARRRVRLDARCRFRSRVTIRLREEGRVLFLATFNGNRALMSAGARARVRVG
jgi:hypothetical protein